MIEEVKKILRRHTLPDYEAWIDEDAKAICQLFPKSPDNPEGYEPKTDMTEDEADKIVRGAAGRRPDLPSGKDFVDEVRHGKIEPKAESGLLTPEKQKEVIENYCGDCRDCVSNTRIYPEMGCYGDAILKAQRDLTASDKEAAIDSLKQDYRTRITHLGHVHREITQKLLTERDTECKQRVERIIKETEGLFPQLADFFRWKFFKKREGVSDA